MNQNIKIKHDKKEAASEQTIKSMDELRLSTARIRRQIEAEGREHTDSGELQREDRER